MKVWENRNTFQPLFFYSFCWCFFLSNQCQKNKNVKTKKVGGGELEVGDVHAISIEHAGRSAARRKRFGWPPCPAGHRPSHWLPRNTCSWHELEQHRFSRWRNNNSDDKQKVLRVHKVTFAAWLQLGSQMKCNQRAAGCFSQPLLRSVKTFGFCSRRELPENRWKRSLERSAPPITNQH